jgi:hypothetical protein
MRRYDKKQNILEANLKLEHEFMLSKRLFETFTNVICEEEGLSAEKIAQTIDKAGGDSEDEDVQKAFLEKLIDSDFEPNNIKVDDVINSDIQENLIVESDMAHNIAHGIHSGLDWIENSETGIQFSEKLTKWSGGLLKINKEKLIKGLHALEKVLNFVPNILSKGIYKIMRKFGGGLESAKVGSIGGEVIWLCVLAGFAITFWPGLAGIAAGGLTILKIGGLLLKLWNLGRTIYKIVKNFVTGVKEVKNVDFSVTDFLDGIEKSSDTNIKVEYDVIKSLEEWFNHLDDDKQQKAQEILKNSYDLFTGGRETKSLEILRPLNLPDDVTDTLGKLVHGKRED